MRPALGRSADGVTGFNTDSSGTWRNLPNASDLSGYTFGSGDRIVLSCYKCGGPGGPYSNTLWCWAGDFSGVNGWINDHDLTTPGTAAAPEPQTSECVPAVSGNPFGQPPCTESFNAGGSGTWSNSPITGDLSG